MALDSSVEIVRRAFAAYAAGDRARLIALVHPEAEIAPLSPDLSGTDGPYRGKRGAELWLEELARTGREFTGKLEEIRESGETVLALGRVQARRPASGFAFTQRVGWVLRTRDELIVFFRGYTSAEDAERAAGI